MFDPAVKVAEDRGIAVLLKCEADRAALAPATTEALRTILHNLQASLDAVELSSLTDQVVQPIKKSRKTRKRAWCRQEVASHHLSGDEAAQTGATAGALAKFNEEAPLCAAL